MYKELYFTRVSLKVCGDVILISLLVLIDALEIGISRSLSAAGIRGCTYY